ncbi:hypothetical protein [Chryseobacterium sp. CBo1]|uniref:hypothetical protein n=1 Tax=Chryseobacterium sp. CBo1 TaxID=1869230 RepID=UPI0013F4E200|nr:hypothetical protein [Chryseobacterium sp. CBo1]
MKKRVFKYKSVYYLAICTTLILMIMSLFAMISMYAAANYFKLFTAIMTLITSLCSFINLIEKYSNAAIYMNINLGLFALILGVNLLFTGISFESKIFQFFIVIIAISVILNLFKSENIDHNSEIEQIGKNQN